LAEDHRLVRHQPGLLTYAGNPANLSRGKIHAIFCSRGHLRRGLVDSILRQHRPRAIVHFAAESMWTGRLLLRRRLSGPMFRERLFCWSRRGATVGTGRSGAAGFRFLHVSTDEVYGSLGRTIQPFRDHRVRSNSPYAASKAASDHLARAYFHTWAVPVLTTNCSNNYDRISSRRS